MPDLKEQLTKALGEMQIHLERSGARVELIGVDDGIAQIRLLLTRPGPSRLVHSLQVKSGIERALKGAIPELRGVEAVNLPPHTLLGWDQPAFRPVDLPVEDAPPKS
jgi:Fe-S cluster biogenesis protein NfuA